MYAFLFVLCDNILVMGYTLSERQCVSLFSGNIRCFYHKWLVACRRRLKLGISTLSQVQRTLQFHRYSSHHQQCMIFNQCQHWSNVGHCRLRHIQREDALFLKELSLCSPCLSYRWERFLVGLQPFCYKWWFSLLVGCLRWWKRRRRWGRGRHAGCIKLSLFAVPSVRCGFLLLLPRRN